MDKTKKPLCRLRAGRGAQNPKAGKNLLRQNTHISAPCQSAEAQRGRILSWLRRDSLTTLEARRALDVMHPAARVMELRRQGHPIETVWTDELSDAGGWHRVARYILRGEVAA
ncbi:helix-turn-helix domain-containing protein [Desulfobulbus elongatus]|uniref:helix-turn-helix domain-containing protein n=1 Tax=Desulfobulbus elongatus TaxID=53332 RepID=UPI000A02B4E4